MRPDGGSYRLRRECGGGDEGIAGVAATGTRRVSTCEDMSLLLQTSRGARTHRSQ